MPSTDQAVPHFGCMPGVRAGVADVYAVGACLTDIIVLAASGTACYAARHATWVLPDDYILAIVLAIAAFVAGGGLIGSYRFANLARRGPHWASVGALLTGVGAFLLVIAYLAKHSDAYSRLWAVGWFTSAWAGLVLLRLGLASRLQSALAGGRLAPRAIILGRAESLRDWLDRHETSPDLAVVALALPVAPATESAWPLPVTTLDRLSASCRNHAVDDVLVLDRFADLGEPAKVLAALRALPARIRLCLDPALAGVPVPTVAPVGTLPAVALFAEPLTGMRRFLKEAEDIILGLLILVLTMPLMLVIAVAIRLDSPGPVVFRQQRRGFAGEEFTVLKFRTMSTDASQDGTVPQATRQDPRITRVGRILRRYSLDELLQVINVLRRDMSLVGPRPHAVPHDDYYGGLIDQYAARQRMRPGMTGWAQVNGLRGGTRHVADMEARVHADIHYIENWSLALDIGILIRTVACILRDRNAF